MRKVKFAVILAAALSIAATGFAEAQREWDSTTSAQEKHDFAAVYARKRCGSKMVGDDSDTIPSFVTKSMVISFIDRQCPEKKAGTR